MRLFLSIGSVLITISSFAQWIDRAAPTFSSVSHIQMIDNSTIFFTGEAGVFKSTDAGLTWTSFTPYNFPGSNLQQYYLYSFIGRGMHFLNGTTGFIYGESSFGYQSIFKTSDGGASFILVYYKLGGYVTSMQFITSMIGYATTSEGKVAKTIDGGQTWSELTIANTSRLNALHFTDATHGVAVGKNVILTTADGGANWTTITTTKDLKHVTHADNQNLFASGDLLELVKSNDGGATWTDASLNNIPTINNYFGRVLFTSPTTGFLATSLGLFKTTDGGNFWAPQRSLGKGSGIGAFDILPNGTGFLRYGNLNMAPSIRFAYTTNGGDPMPEHEAQATELITYANDLCRGTYPITTRIINHSAIPLTTAVVKWTVNGVSQTDYNWTGNIAPGATSDPITIGSYNFTKTAKDYTIVAKTSVPNGAADPYPDDDATEQGYRFNKLTGDYVIGGANSDFGTINEPVDLLRSYGMCTAVTFNITPGSYQERISLVDIAAVTATNRLTFQSSTGNAADVVIGNASTSSQVFVIDNTSHVTIRRLTVRGAAMTLYINRLADDVVIEDNILSASFVDNEQSVITLGQVTGNIAIRNNKFSGGDIGIFHNIFSQTATAAEVSIEKNTFENHKAQAIFLAKLINANISGNVMRLSGTGNSTTGVWFREYEGEAKLVNNFIEALTTGQQTWAVGVFADRVTGKVTLYNNTIYKRSIANNAAIIVFDSKNITLRNNSITSYGNGDAFLFNSNTNLSSDYNNLFSLKGSIGTFRSPTKEASITAIDLRQWQLATNGLDLHSISVDPQHVEGSSHVSPGTSNFKLNGAATPIAGVTTDIDGETRNATTPDIGADEFNGPTIDIGISASPANATVCFDNSHIPLTITNYGTTTVNGFDISWTLNGSSTPQHFIQTIFAGESLSVDIGPVSGSGNLSIALSKSGDQIASNNTASVTVSGNGMSGTYTVGGTNPDFATIAAAMSALQTNGVCDDVTINIRPGNYNENLSLGVIPNTAEDRRVIFQSSTRDSTDVVISGNATNIKFARTSFVTLRHVSIGHPDTFNQIKFDLLAVHHVTLEGNRIRNQLALNVGSNFENPAPSEYNLIKGNNFSPLDGTPATVLKVVGEIASFPTGLTNTGLRARGNVIENNVVTSNPALTWQETVIYVTSQDGFRVANNVIDVRNDTYSSGVDLEVSDALNAYQITGNHLGGNGLRIWSSISENSEMGLVANNFISGTFQAHYADNFRFVNNTVVAEYFPPSTSPGAWATAVNINPTISSSIVGTPDRIEFKNNIVATRGDMACVAFHPGIVDSDYNVFFSSYNDKLIMNSGGTIGEPGYSTFYQSLSGWQSGTGLDAHSLFFDPTFVSTTDLHIANDARLARKGTNVGITSDIDGDGRLVATPDIGADEFSQFNADAGVVAFTTELLCGSSTDLKVRIRNFSKNALTQVSIRWSVNGNEQTPKSWTGNLASKETSAPVSVGNFSFQPGFAYELKFWTNLPNGAADEYTGNDAITRGPLYSYGNNSFYIESSTIMTSFCQGTPPTLNVHLPSEMDYTFAWKKGVDNVGTNQSFLNITAGGTYSVTVSAGGCVFTPAPITMTEVIPPAAPTITPIGSLEFCVGGSVKLTVPSGAPGYLWSNGQTTNEITVTAEGDYTARVKNSFGCPSAPSAIAQVKVNPLPAKPAITPNGSLTFCEGGSVTLSAPVGLASYQWSTGQTTQSIVANATGPYLVTVKDSKGCQSVSSDPIQVEKLAPLSPPVITVDGQTTFCDGGSVVLRAPAGFTTYNWSNGATTKDITVTSTGTFTVSVKNSQGCQSPVSAIVSVNEYSPVPVPEVTAGGSLKFCNGGSVVLSAPAGFTYLWSTGATSRDITANASGKYSVKVTDVNGCLSQASQEVEVVEFDEVPVPVVTFLTGSATFCAGSSATLVAPDGFASYQWSDGQTTRAIAVSTDATLTVTVTDVQGCKSLPSATTTIDVKDNPVAVITSNGTELQATAGGDNYNWFLNNNSISGAHGSTFAPNESGSYTVQVTKNGCSTTSAAFPMIVNGLNETTGFQVYPNPASSYIVLTGQSIGQGTFEFQDATGRTHSARVRERSENRIVLGLESLSSGVYIIQGTLNNDTIVRYRIVLTR